MGPLKPVQLDFAAQAAAYLALGWAPIPVRFREKRPTLSRWQNLRLSGEDLPHHFPAPSNIGVLLGKVSGELVDVDLDCAEAVHLAPRLLPVTWCFGRASKPRSHWLYVARQAVSEKFAHAGTLLELRASGQTVFPPSTHVSGELIEWSPEDLDAAEGPFQADAGELRDRVALLAAAALVMRAAGVAAAEAWIAGADFPATAPEVANRVRQWLGLEHSQLGRKLSASRRRGGDFAGLLRRARLYLAHVPGAVSGSGGHVQTLLAAEHMVRGFELDDSAALGVLLEHFNPRCVPPWSERELAHKVRQAREHGTAIAFGQHLEGR